MSGPSLFNISGQFVSRHRTLSVLAFAVVLLLLNRPAAVEWWTRVVAEERYSHIPFVLLTVFYLIWLRRGEIGPGNAGARPGLVLVVCCAMLLFAGELSAIWTLVQYGIVGLVIGMVWCLVGRQIRVIAWPLLLIVMTVPLPYMIDVMFTGKMQLMSSELGAMVLRGFSVPVFLEGNVLDFGNFKLQVVEACSGLNYAFPLLTIGVLFAYIYRGPAWMRALLILSTLPISIVMNSIRIAAVGVLVDRYGNEAAGGFLHYFEGWMVFIVCLLLLLAEAKLADLLRGQRASLLDALADGLYTTVRVQHEDAPFSARPAMVAALLVVVLSSVFALRPAVDVRPVERRSLVSFPLVVGEWTGLSVPFMNQEDRVLGLSDYIQADYSAPGGRQVGLYIGYTGSQRSGFVPHSPQACIPGGGWNIDSISILGVPVEGRLVNVTRLTISRENSQQIVYYWYRQRGHDLSNEYSMKLSLLVDAIVKGRTDGSIVRLTSPVTRSPEATDAELQGFMNKLYPLLPTYIPD